MKRNVFISLATAATLLSSCGKEESKKDNTPPVKIYEGASFSLIGMDKTTWASDCLPVKDKDNRSRHTTIFLQEPRFEVVETFFDGLDCQQEQKRLTYRDRNYSVQKESSGRLAGWETIVYRIESTTLELHREMLAMDYNDYSIYGYGDWAVGEQKEISGRKFNAESEPELPHNEPRELTMKIENDVLYFARYEDGTPVASTDFAYKKVQP